MQASDALLESGINVEDILSSEDASELDLPGAAVREVVGARRWPWRRIGAAVMLAGLLAAVMPMVLARQQGRPPARAGIVATTQRPQVLITAEEVKAPRGMLTINEQNPDCYLKDKFYGPSLDMLGSIPLAATDAAACQDRCSVEDDCAYFSFDYVSKVCHLQDSAATLQPVSMTFIAGPKECATTTATSTSSTVTSTETVTTTQTTTRTTTSTVTTETATTTTETTTTETTTKAPTTVHTTSTPPWTPPPTKAPTTRTPTTPTTPTMAPTLPSTRPPITTPPAPFVTQPPSTLQPSVFCFLVMMPTGYEPELVRAQVIKRAGIFNCNEYAAYSVEQIDLGSGIHTKVISGNTSSKGSWGSWLNTKNFISAWDDIFAAGRFQHSEWTVKVDPDCVFFPDRLRLHLHKFYPAGTADSVYLKNCPKDLGLQGSLEVFSRAAVELYGKHSDECKQKCNPEGSGEDGYIRACFDMLGAQSKQDFDLLIDNYCGFGTCKSNDWNVAFHPYKDTDEWFQCWAEAQGGDPTPELSQ